MPDWREHVRARLPRMAIRPERENEIVAELALQMEQTYQDALAGGSSEAQAEDRACEQFPDWRALGREIDQAEAPRARWWASVMHRGPFGAIRCLPPSRW